MSELNWRKSTRTGHYNCAEVALSPEVTAVRDSKDPDGGHVTITAARWGLFLQGLKTGRYDR